MQSVCHKQLGSPLFGSPLKVGGCSTSAAVLPAAVATVLAVAVAVAVAQAEADKM